MKILVSDNLSQKGIEIFKKTSGFTVDVKTGMSPDELKAVIGDYDAIAIRSATKVTSDIIDHATNLKVIGRAGTGLDNVDIAAASKRGIVVMNVPGGNTITTAEHAVSMMMSLARHIPHACASMKGHKWEKKKFIGTELTGKTLGIIGIGKIGSVVADRAKGLKMNVIAYDPFISEEKAVEMGLKVVDLDELYAQSDVISIHVPRNEETMGMVNAEAFAKMKDGVFVLNCARGGLINEKDLYDAIKSGKVAGAALDVHTKEPPEDFSLVDLPQVICTPHLGASTTEAQEKVAVDVALQMVDYLTSGTVRNAVNVPSVSAEELESFRPYLELAERLGSFLGQVISSGIEEINVELGGDVAEYPSQPITISILKGLLTPVVQENVNFVNAMLVAKERGIKVKQSILSESSDYTNLISIRVASNRDSWEVHGSIFGKKEPLIVKVNKFNLEAHPEGNIVLIFAEDRPGVIGSIGTEMGANDINIAHMEFGREKVGGKSLLFLNTDSEASTEVLAKLKKLPNINSVKQLKIEI